MVKLKNYSVWDTYSLRDAQCFGAYQLHDLPNDEDFVKELEHNHEEYAQ